jgi:hypothetical protein
MRDDSRGVGSGCLRPLPAVRPRFADRAGFRAARVLATVRPGAFEGSPRVVCCFALPAHPLCLLADPRCRYGSARLPDPSSTASARGPIAPRLTDVNAR